MFNKRQFYLILPGILLFVAGLACGLPATKTQPKATISPIVLSNDLTQIDLCQAIPVEDIEAVLGRKLINAPQRFDYYGVSGSSGCTYDAGKDSSGAAYFGYVVLTPISEYNNQPLYKNIDVSGIGDEAYLNNGADARQLWVKISDKEAFVVAFGDEPNDDGDKAIARLMINAIK